MLTLQKKFDPLFAECLCDPPCGDGLRLSTPRHRASRYNRSGYSSSGFHTREGVGSPPPGLRPFQSAWQRFPDWRRNLWDSYR